MNSLIIEKKISPSWNVVSEILDKIRASISDHGTELMDSTTTVVNELIENALKYGEFCPEKPENCITLHVEINENEIEILISNFVTSQENLKNFILHIDKINKTSNPKDLYVARLKELIKENHFETSQLGLYKISCETKFNLEYKLEKDLLTIYAKRKIRQSGELQ